MTRVSEVCIENRVRYSDEESLKTYVLVTMESEMISFYSKQAILMIKKYFDFESLLNQLNKENWGQGVSKEKLLEQYSAMLKKRF